MTDQEKLEIYFREARGFYEDTRVVLHIEDSTPEICGFFGRACRRMLEHRPGLESMLCSNCPISKIYSIAIDSPF